MDVEDLYLRERESGDLHFFARRSFHAEDGQYMRIKTDAPVFLCTHGKTGVFYSKAHGGAGARNRGLSLPDGG